MCVQEEERQTKRVEKHEREKERLQQAKEAEERERQVETDDKPEPVSITHTAVLCSKCNIVLVAIHTGECGAVESQQA